MHICHAIKAWYRQRAREEEMTHCVVRIYSGASDRSVDDILKLASRELAPELMKAHCRRYSLVEFADGRFGSSSFYDDEAAAQRGMDVAAAWVRETNAM